MQASQANDTTVLPRAIVRRSAAIQARIDARNAEPKTDPADPNTPPEAPKAATPVDPNSPIPAVPPATPAADPRESDPAYWRQRFNVTQGVLRTEREARQTETSDFNRRLTEMQEQVRTLQAKTAPDETQLDVTQFFTPEQIDQFGEDQCKAMALAATKSAQAAVQAAIEKEVKPLREQEQRREARTVEERKQEFVDKLTELVPNYADIDQGDDWREWLAQEDEATGLQRQVILSTHTQALNAPKVSKMFADFLKTKARPAPPVVGKGSGAGPSGDPPPPASPAAARPPTDAEVKDFYKRAALGKVKDSERTEFEARMKLRATAR